MKLGEKYLAVAPIMSSMMADLQDAAAHTAP